VEAVIAVLIVGVMLVAALQALASAKGTRYRLATHARARMLAHDLLAEVLATDYADPQTPAAALGPDTGESATDRTGFDDVDDYDGLSDGPPTTRSGAAIANHAGFTRAVSVAWADLSTPTADATSDSGLKRVTVTVTVDGRVLAELVGYRADAWEYLP